MEASSTLQAENPVPSDVVHSIIGGTLIHGTAGVHNAVSPATGETVGAFSLLDATQAAEAAAAWFKGDTNALAAYSERVANEHGRDMKWAARVAKAFYAMPRLAYSVGISRPSATRTMGRLLTGEIKWHEVAPRALARLVSPRSLLS